MKRFSDEERQRYQTLAKGDFFQSDRPLIQSFFRRAEEESAAIFADAYAGDISFFNAPRLNDLEKIDIACVGVPFEVSAPLRAGARFGPRSYREWSKLRGPVHEVWGTIPFEQCSVADYGDVLLTSPHSIRDCADQVTAKYEEFRAHNISPLSVGGVHTMTHPILKGLAGEKPLGLVHIDAHCDTSRGDFQGDSLSDCGVFLNATLDEAIDPTKVVQIGIRGSLSAYWEFSHDSGMRVIPMHEFFEIGVKGVIEEIHRVIGDHPFYFSMDCDGIDSTYLPGTQLPEPFGLTSREVLQIIRGMRGMDIVGADTVELCPPYDPHGISANLCAALGFETLCLLSEAHVARNNTDRKTHWNNL